MKDVALESKGKFSFHEDIVVEKPFSRREFFPMRSRWIRLM
jgi:hypothetical protein